MFSEPNININSDNMLYSMKSMALGLELLDQTQSEITDAIHNTPKEDNIVREAIIKVLNLAIRESDTVGVTFTLKRKYHNEDNKWMHRYIQEKIEKSRIWKKKKYVLIPEFTSSGNLHYHSIIWGSYQCEVMKMVNWWRRTFGFAKAELELRHPECWIKYITKDYGKTGLWTLYNVQI